MVRFIWIAYYQLKVDAMPRIKDEDMIGKRFGLLEVIAFLGMRRKKSNWACICDCGKVRSAMGSYLRFNHIRSCGCMKKYVDSRKTIEQKKIDYFATLPFSEEELSNDYLTNNMSQPDIKNKYNVGFKRIKKALDLIGVNFKQKHKEDLTGRTFGRWSVKGKGLDNRLMYLCVCDCGTIREVPPSRLKSGRSTSCGCYDLERKTKHGRTRTRVYRTYMHMVDRCYNAKDDHYKWYGGRGISVCERWLGVDGFINFLEDMGDRPRGKSLDRIDNDGDYEPTNCRWATQQQQTRNSRSAVILELGGEKKCIKEWSEILGIDRVVIGKRKKEGWPDYLNLTTPSSKRVGISI